MLKKSGFFSIITLWSIVVGCGDAGNAKPAVDAKNSQTPKTTSSTQKMTTDKAASSAGSDKTANVQKSSSTTVKVPEVQTASVPTTSDVTPDKAKEKAPETFTVRFETSKGNIDVDVKREWAPLGADRFYNLVKLGYYNDVAFFRVIPNFMAQVGLSGTPELNKIWRSARITDDPVKQSNTRGMVTFATSGRNSRTTQFFINFRNNARLDGMGFAPFGKVKDSSLAVLDSLHGGYGEGAPRGRGPSQGRIQREGNTYLKANFPKLDYIKRAVLVN